VEFLSLLHLYSQPVDFGIHIRFNSRSGIPQLAPSCQNFHLTPNQRQFQFQKWNSSACSIHEMALLLARWHDTSFQFQKWNSSACSGYYSTKENKRSIYNCFNSRSGIPQLAPVSGEENIEVRIFLFVSIPEVEFLSLLPAR